MKPAGPKGRLAAAAAAVSLLVVTACGGSGEDGLPDLSGQTVSVAGVWSGAEQDVFEKVMDEFSDATGAEMVYTSTGDDIATVLNSKIEGDAAPDVAFLPQPGLMDGYAERGDIDPLSDDTIAAVDENYADIWKRLGSFDGNMYGIWFDVSNKSTVWYNAKRFDKAGVQPPNSWDELLNVAEKLGESGVDVPISLAGADGWTLTDWFENLYIRIAGPEKYDRLSTHSLAWTDDSVIETLTVMGELFSNTKLVGKSGAVLDVDFSTSVSNVFADSPESAIVYEGSFVSGVISDTSDFSVGDDARWFPFPSVQGSPESVIGGGDVAVKFNDDDATEAFMTFLASPRAASIMVSTGSFTSANKSVDPSVYPDKNSRGIGQAIVDAGNNFRFDMSDLAPPEFGSTVGSGEWKILRDFLRDPSDPAGTAQQLEHAAAQAFG